jgi:hypothetical protein
LEECPSDMFENNNPNRNKQLNEFAKKMYVLIAWINEFSDKKINNSDFKNFCDGRVKTTKLYVDGTTTITLKCKLIGTANTMPNFQVDTGTMRRFLGYTPKSQFVDSKDKVNESKQIYLKDKYLLENLMKKKNLLNAWVDILAGYCVLNFNNEAPPLTENVKATTSDVISTNDIIQDFIDSSLIITNNVDKDRIGKDDMRKAFHEKYPEKHLSVQQLISSLKEKDIAYNPKFRANNVQGCYVGVKLRSETPNRSNNSIAMAEKDDENETLKCKIKELEQKLAEMKELTKADPDILSDDDLEPEIEIKKIKRTSKVKTSSKVGGANFMLGLLE